VKDSWLTTMARRGLTFPAETREQIRKTGIRCRPQLEIVFQQRANEWKLRGEESGGAVADLGHDVGFVGKDGEAIPWLQRVQNFLPNGVHAVVVEAALIRVEMFRYEHTYDLLITCHSLDGAERKRPELRSQILFRGATARSKRSRGGMTQRFVVAPCLTSLLEAANRACRILLGSRRPSRSPRRSAAQAAAIAICWKQGQLNTSSRCQHDRLASSPHLRALPLLWLVPIYIGSRLTHC
jgi:hypothetical protein